jgi:hypothetical protein
MSNEPPPGYRGGFWLRTRPIWASAVLVTVGIISSVRYPDSNLGGFYSTSAQIIVTLWVAIAVGTFVGSGGRPDMKPDHWVFLIVSSAGLLASLRGVSAGSRSYPWLTGMTVVGVTAAVLLVAENIVAWRAGRLAPLWTTLFVAVTIVFVLVP